jgi:putative membrane protein
MISNPYSRFASTQFILRDQLAIDRTFLANERTFLSYLRTGLAFALTGAGCLRFSDNMVIHGIGVLMIVSSLMITAIGALRTMRVHKVISALNRNIPPGTPPGVGMPPDGPV